MTATPPDSSSDAGGKAAESSAPVEQVTQVRVAPDAPDAGDAPTTLRAAVTEKTEMLMERRAATLTAPAERAVDFVPGALIKGRFLLKEQIGRGGMGVVFAAIDKRKEEARDPNPWVAIKILGAAFAGYANAFIVLQREARKAQSLAHPNVATVFDFDRDGDAVFMTMELLRGRPLDQVIRDARGHGLERAAAWRIVRGIAEGLAYAHRKGIVHSDLKPGNVFLLDDGQTKILDFGIARAVPIAGESTETSEPRDTFDAGKLGAYTEAYATPEMVAGIDPHPADDIYALGLIAYELMSGAHPFKRMGAVEAQRLKLKAPTPKGLRRRQRLTLERSLSFVRRERPRDAAEFLRQLNGITRLQQALIAATVILALAAGYFGYDSYRETGPSVAFAQLPAQVQQEWRTYMHDGDQLLHFYAQDNSNVVALQDAVSEYAKAYQLHPRNRDAVRALKKSADTALDAMQNNPEQQRAFAKALAERSDFLAKYPPVRDAIR